MRILILLFLSLGANAQMLQSIVNGGTPSVAIAFVSATAGQSTTAVASVGATAFSTTTGNHLVVGIRIDSHMPPCSFTPSVADTAGNTFTLDKTTVNASICEWLFSAKSITGNASDVVTASWTGGNADFDAIGVMQFSGVTAGTLDATGTASGTGNSATTGAFTTTSANQVLAGCAELSNLSTTFTPGTGYAVPAASVNSSAYHGCEYKIVSAIQTGVTATISFSASAAYAFNLATYKQ